MTEPVISIVQGELNGKLCKTAEKVQYYAFKSIPYAVPPVGKLRFCAPEPPLPWEGVRDATKNCNICLQIEKTDTKVGDEDCLYLNVYTPKLPTANTALPVMVFFHGGGFVFGNGTEDTVHGPDFLIGKDVVIVSINYRLGILGFLTLDIKEAPGNMGLKDQVQALKWVQQNISKFGGDPKNVTIFGISAGGASVEYLVISPMANGLFHKAIAQSGSSLQHWARSNKLKELARMVPLVEGNEVTDDQALLEYLKNMSAEKLVRASMLIMKKNCHKGGFHFGFVPTIEKQGDWVPFLDNSPYDLLSKGEFSKVPFMSGFCEREGLLIAGMSTETIERFTTQKEFIKYLPFDVDDTQTSEIEKRLKNIYLESECKKYTNEGDAFAIDYFSDIDFIAGVYVASSLISKHSSPVYMYEFAYDGGLNYLKKKLSIERAGACHGDDGGYLVKSGLLPEELSDADRLMRDRLVDLWTNFAKYGDPTPNITDVITTKWEPIAETGMACLVIDDNLTMKHDIYPKRMAFYQELYAKYGVN